VRLLLFDQHTLKTIDLCSLLLATLDELLVLGSCVVNLHLFEET
jgi:hypothetical protein